MERDLQSRYHKYILSPREIVVLELLIQGKDSRQIAAILEIEKNTVGNPRKNMLRKTASKNILQVAITVFKNGW